MDENPIPKAYAYALWPRTSPPLSVFLYPRNKINLKLIISQEESLITGPGNFQQLLHKPKPTDGYGPPPKPTAKPEKLEDSYGPPKGELITEGYGPPKDDSEVVHSGIVEDLGGEEDGIDIGSVSHSANLGSRPPHRVRLPPLPVTLKLMARGSSILE